MGYDDSGGGGLSWIGIVKWILVFLSVPTLLKAWEGIASRVVTAGYGGPDTAVVSGDEALRYGVKSLVWGIGFLVAAILIWYFWERDVD